MLAQGGHYIRSALYIYIYNYIYIYIYIYIIDLVSGAVAFKDNDDCWSLTSTQ